MKHSAAEKAQIVREIKSLNASGTSINESCLMANVSVGSFRRWVSAYDKAGVAGLEHKKGNGCPTIVSKYDLTDAAVMRLRELKAKSGSDASALKFFRTDPLCPPKFTDYITGMTSRHNIPQSIRRLMHLTKEMKARVKGPKHFDEIGFIGRRSMTEVDVNGVEHDVKPGDWWESDDMSINQPFWFELDDGMAATRAGRGDALAKKYSVAIGRQGLFTRDIGSGKWLGHEFIGRPRDAYRAEDVLRMFRHLFEEHGLPRRGIRLERGVWESKTIDGKRVVMSDGEREKVVCGLQDLGIEVVHVFRSRNKPFIEGGFDHLQTYLAMALEDCLNLGRNRGEMENDTRQYMRARGGVIHPSSVSIPDIFSLSERVSEVEIMLNGERQEGDLLDCVADDVWCEAMNEKPLRVLENKDIGLFMPVKAEIRIRNGHVIKKLNGEKYWFTAPELFAELGREYKLLVCFDPADVMAGAEVYNLECGSKNRSGATDGQWLGHAEWALEAPQFGAAEYTGMDSPKEQKKRYTRAFRSAYAGTGMNGSKGRKVAKTARDGRGGSAVIERISIQSSDDSLQLRGSKKDNYETREIHENDRGVFAVDMIEDRKRVAADRRRSLSREGKSDVAERASRADAVEAEMRASGELVY